MVRLTPLHRGRVLIVGAGPTGLVLANCLARYGVPYHLIEQRAAPSADSKALALNVLSQLMLRLIGLGGVVGAKAHKLTRLNIYYAGKRLNPIKIDGVDADIKWILAQPQAQTEQELVSALERNGGVIDWSTRVTGVRIRPHHVEASLSGAQGVRTETYEYVVGCDGKHSVVRQSMGVSLEGPQYPMHFELGDFRLNWARAETGAHYFVYDDTFLIVVPIGDGYWRVVLKRPGAPSSDKVDESRVIADVEDRLGPGVVDGGSRWLSRAPFYMRTTDTLWKGRASIAGDAAHLFSPIGGTGMNTGIQDAINLSWRLAYAWHGVACPDRMLSGYQAERLHAIKQTAVLTDAATRIIGRLETDPKKWDVFLPTMRNRGAVRRVLPMRHAGLDVRTPPAECPESGSGEFCRGWPSLLERLMQLRHSAARAHHVCAFLDKVEGENLVQQQLLRIGNAFLERDSKTALWAVSLHASDAVVAPPGWTAVSLQSWRDLKHWDVTGGQVCVVRPDGVVALKASLEGESTIVDYARAVWGRPGRAHGADRCSDEPNATDATTHRWLHTR